MPNISITPANVKPSDSAQVRRGVAGETITAGQAVFRDEQRRMMLSDADAPAKAFLDGIAVNGASLGQPLNYAVQDAALDLGTTVGSGEIVVLSDTPGGLMPAGDLGAGDRTVIVGVGTGGTKLSFKADVHFRGGVIPV